MRTAEHQVEQAEWPGLSTFLDRLKEKEATDEVLQVHADINDIDLQKVHRGHGK